MSGWWYVDKNYRQFEELQGRIFTSCRVLKASDGCDNDEIHFVTTDGEKFIMTHLQDCCEHVYIEDVCGDLDDLIGVPIVLAHESVQTGEGEWGDTWTHTFYNISTIKGSVTLRWCGSSNGYYSESVSLFTLTKGLPN